MKKKNNILIWGGSNRAHRLLALLENTKLINKKFFKLKNYHISIFDSYIKNLNFNFKGKFYNSEKQLPKIIQNFGYFIVAIGAGHGKARYFISKELEKSHIKPVSLISKFSIIDSHAKLGVGLQIEPGAIIQCYSSIGDYCIINTNATVEHSTKIGHGCHIMGGASIAGRVELGNFVSIGTNSTILPDIKIEDGAYIGAGSVVTKNVKKNEIVVGIPARKSGINKHRYNLKPLKDL